MTAIKVSNLSKSYGPVRALQSVSFQVNQGEIVGLLGPNGAGKTTLMKILTGFIQPDDGVAKVCGHDIETATLQAQQMIGYLPEHVPLYLDMTVETYLGSVAELRGLPASQRGPAIEQAIIDVGLEEYYTRPIRNLSKGYRQRVGIAQAILHRPSLLILDEPTTGLDPNQIVEIRNLIQTLGERATIILSTHILSEVEASCQRVLIIDGGRLKADGEISAMKQRKGAFVATIVDGRGAAAKLKQLSTNALVTELREHEGAKEFRVVDPDIADLGAAIFALCSREGLTLRELRPEVNNLEAVFREVAGHQEVQSA